VAVLLALVGCAAADGSDDASSSSDDALTSATSGAAHTPIAFLLQFTGEYRGPEGGTFDSLDLLRDGSFIATVNGVRKTGRYEGPHAPKTPLKISFILGGDHFTGTITEDWTEHQQLHIARGSVSEILASTWKAGSEELCDETGGKWHDDDPDPATHLDCTCRSPEVYIPSAGGCTD
jgi:hypothetical protein